jgi:hypothetical protein
MACHGGPPTIALSVKLGRITGALTPADATLEFSFFGSYRTAGGELLNRKGSFDTVTSSASASIASIESANTGTARPIDLL